MCETVETRTKYTSGVRKIISGSRDRGGANVALCHAHNRVQSHPHGARRRHASVAGLCKRFRSRQPHSRCGNSVRTSTETRCTMSLKLPTPTQFSAFPFSPYEIQLDLMRHVFSAIEDKKVAIMESPTGTVCSILDIFM